jgi:cobalt-zinc-cadmium efflux system protein
MTQTKRLSLVLLLNVTLIIGLVVVGLASHSLGVLAAGGDYTADSVAILLGIIAIQISKHPHGHPRATTYVALINSVALLAVTAIVMFEGIHRLLRNTPHIDGLPVLIVSAIATLFMIAGAFVLGRDAGKEDLHMRSVLLDTISDALSSATVAVIGAIIYFTGKFFWLDSAVAILISVVIGFGALKLLWDVIHSLRQHHPLDAT